MPTVTAGRDYNELLPWLVTSQTLKLVTCNKGERPYCAALEKRSSLSVGHYELSRDDIGVNPPSGNGGYIRNLDVVAISSKLGVDENIYSYMNRDSVF